MTPRTRPPSPLTAFQLYAGCLIIVCANERRFVDLLAAAIVAVIAWAIYRAVWFVREAIERRRCR